MKNSPRAALTIILNILFVLVAGWVLLTIIHYVAPSPKAKPLYQADGFPEHQVVTRTLTGTSSQDVAVNVPYTDLTMKKCRELLDKYRGLAEPEGQIAVYKPREAVGSPLAPWCENKFDGQGITFNF